MAIPSSFISPPKLRRGAQPRNQNARKTGTYSRFQPGPLNPALLQLHFLNAALLDPVVPPVRLLRQARTLRDHLCHSPATSQVQELHTLQLILKAHSLTHHIQASISPILRRSEALQRLARDPLGWIAAACRDHGITHDADSFFPSSIKSAQYSPSPGLPDLPTNLTDSQWASIASLVPPDPQRHWLTGEPPAIIAANRWHFTRYVPSGDVREFVVMQRYYQVLHRCPTISSLPSLARQPVRALESGRGRGRPRTSPRLLLDAIFWKFSTGRPWHSLPSGFPPMRVCRDYYRRILRSGRWFTLLLALFNHFEQHASTDLLTLLEKGLFTTTSSQKIALDPRAPLTWENCTALLFMQLARSACSHLYRVDSQSHPGSTLQPVFKGTASLTTGLPPGTPLSPPHAKPSSPPTAKPSLKPSSLPSPSPGSSFQPLEASLAWRKWLKIEQNRQTLALELSRRIRNIGPPASFSSGKVAGSKESL